mgnify:CR=1 FL=1
MSQGTLIASGFIAGGALMGVVGAILKFADVDWKLTQWNSSNAASWVGLGMYLALIIYFAVHSLRAKKGRIKINDYTMELKDRFLKYVSFDTQSDESSETFPSTAKQRVLLDYLAEEMKALGLTEVTVDKYGYAMGTIPATPGCEKSPRHRIHRPRGQLIFTLAPYCPIETWLFRLAYSQLSMPRTPAL